MSIFFSLKCQNHWKNISQRRKVSKLWFANTIEQPSSEKLEEKSDNWNWASQNTAFGEWPNPNPTPDFLQNLLKKNSVTQPNWEVSRKCSRSKQLIKTIIISVINFWLSCAPALQVEDSVVVHIKNHLTKSHLFFRYYII